MAARTRRGRGRGQAASPAGPARSSRLCGDSITSVPDDVDAGLTAPPPGLDFAAGAAIAAAVVGPGAPRVAAGGPVVDRLGAHCGQSPQACGELSGRGMPSFACAVASLWRVPRMRRGECAGGLRQCNRDASGAVLWGRLRGLPGRRSCTHCCPWARSATRWSLSSRTRHRSGSRRRATARGGGGGVEGAGASHHPRV
jgi:hypothetical protein